jgi:hypothetical protein
MRHLLILDHFEEENYHTNVYLYRICYRFHLNTLQSAYLVSCVPQTMRILYNTSLLTES